MSTKIIAHRGASHLAPENTMPAFNLAYQLGAEGIETDVQLTKDDVPVLIHDERVKRTTNGIGYIKDYTLEQLKSLDAGTWFSKEFTGTTIISLQEFLHWIKPKPLCLNIELKNNKIDYENMEIIVYEMLKDHRLLNRTTLSTFNPSSIKRIRNLYTDIDVAFLTSRRNKNLVHYVKELGANAVHIKYRLLNQSLINHCKRENIAVRVYTINKMKHMMKCFSHQCDGIFTDVPKKALKYRKLYDLKEIL